MKEKNKSKFNLIARVIHVYLKWSALCIAIASIFDEKVNKSSQVLQLHSSKWRKNTLKYSIVKIQFVANMNERKENRLTTIIK